MLYDESAEDALLGSVLLSNEVLIDLSSRLAPDDFAVPENRDIYAKMLDLFHSKKPIDPVHLNGSLPPLRAAELMECVPTAKHADSYAEIIVALARRRQLQNAGREILRIAEEETDVEAAVAAAENHVLALRATSIKQSLKPVSELLPAFHDRLEKKSRGEIPPGKRLGLKELDNILSGLEPTDMIVIAARPAMGKTSLALQLALNTFDQDPDAQVAFFSMEMGEDQILSRAVCQLADLDSNRVRNGNLIGHEWDALVSAERRLSECRLHIDCAGFNTMSRIASECRRLKMRSGLDMVFIDYLQLLQPTTKGVVREQQVAMDSKAAKCLAMDLQVPVFLLSQLNRSVESREEKRPNLHDLRESGSIEQDADRVIFIYRGFVYGKGDSEFEAELLVRKNRHGATGTAIVHFEPSSMQFSDS